MSFENLTDDNIMLYAAKAYDKPNCIMSEFDEDMKKLNYLTYDNIKHTLLFLYPFYRSY